MGPGRSLPGLIEKYAALNQTEPPTRSKTTLKRWSMTFSWFKRAVIFDQRLEEEKNARARQIMESGLALDYERVVELKALADFLKAQVYAATTMIVTVPVEPDGDGEAQPAAQIGTGMLYPNVWVRDVKSIGQGQHAQRVDVYRFNAALLDQFRGVLDDLAKETGGRVAKHEMSGPGGGPIEVTDEQHDRAISTLAAALGALLPGGGGSAEGGLGSAE